MHRLSMSQITKFLPRKEFSYLAMLKCETRKKKYLDTLQTLKQIFTDCLLYRTNATITSRWLQSKKKKKKNNKSTHHMAICRREINFKRFQKIESTSDRPNGMNNGRTSAFGGSSEPNMRDKPPILSNILRDASTRWFGAEDELLADCPTVS